MKILKKIFFFCYAKSTFKRSLLVIFDWGHTTSGKWIKAEISKNNYWFNLLITEKKIAYKRKNIALWFLK